MGKKSAKRQNILITQIAMLQSALLEVDSQCLRAEAALEEADHSLTVLERRCKSLEQELKRARKVVVTDDMVERGARELTKRWLNSPEGWKTYERQARACIAAALNRED